jgi:hypothetical protein
LQDEVELLFGIALIERKLRVPTFHYIVARRVFARNREGKSIVPVRPKQDAPLRYIFEDPLRGYPIRMWLQVELNPGNGIDQRETENKKEGRCGDSAAEDRG